MPRLLGWNGKARTPRTEAMRFCTSARICCCVRVRWSQGARVSAMKPALETPCEPAEAKVATISPESRSGWISRSISRMFCDR